MKKGAKIFIVGPAGSGKSTFAGMLRQALACPPGLPSDAPHTWPYVAECGDLLIRRLANIQAHGRWPNPAPADEWALYIRKRKEEYREQLRALGDQLAIDAPARLLSECADNAAIVVGARRRAEVIAYYGCDCFSDQEPFAQEAALQRGDCWIFVERPGAGLAQTPLNSDSRLATDSFDREWFDRFCGKHVINRGETVPLQHEADLLAAELKS